MPRPQPVRPLLASSANHCCPRRIIIHRIILHCDLLMRFMWATYFSHNDASLLPQIYMFHLLFAHYIQTARWCPVIYFTATGVVCCFTFSLVHEYDKPFNRMIFHAKQFPVQTLAFMCFLAFCLTNWGEKPGRRFDVVKIFRTDSVYFCPTTQQMETKSRLMSTNYQHRFIWSACGNNEKRWKRK